MTCLSWVSHVFFSEYLRRFVPQQKSNSPFTGKRKLGKLVEGFCRVKWPEKTRMVPEQNRSKNRWESCGCLFKLIPPSRNGNFIGNLFHPQIFRPNQAKEPRERVCSHRSSSSLGSPGRCEPTDNYIIAQLLFSRWCPKKNKKPRWLKVNLIPWYFMLYNSKDDFETIMSLRLALLHICVSEASCHFCHILIGIQQSFSQRVPHCYWWYLYPWSKHFLRRYKTHPKKT